MALALALLVHGALVGLMALTHELSPEDPAERKPARPASAVAMRPLSAEQWERNRAQHSSNAPSPKVTRREEKEKKPEKIPKGQVVDVAPGNRQQAPDAQHLAEHDNKVQKETRAREQTAQYRNAMPQRTAPQTSQGAGQDSAQTQQLEGNNGLGLDDRPLTEAGKQQLALEIPEARRREEIALKTDPRAAGPGVSVSNRTESQEMVGNSKRLRIQPGREGSGEEGSQGRVGTPGLTTLMPSQAVMNSIVGAAPNDHLKDVEEGDGTFLNTREWKYATFFNRVKQSVGVHWKPSEQLRRRDPTGNIYSGRDRFTLLSVTLDAQGRVQDVQVEKSSGLDFLDMEAVASFQRAQPFPNPPPGLLDGDSRVKFSFGFFMEFGGGPRMRIFRQPY